MSAGVDGHRPAGDGEGEAVETPRGAGRPSSRRPGCTSSRGTGTRTTARSGTTAPGSRGARSAGRAPRSPAAIPATMIGGVDLLGLRDVGLRVRVDVRLRGLGDVERRRLCVDRGVDVADLADVDLAEPNPPAPDAPARGTRAPPRRTRRPPNPIPVEDAAVEELAAGDAELLLVDRLVAGDAPLPGRHRHRAAALDRPARLVGPGPSLRVASAPRRPGRSPRPPCPRAAGTRRRGPSRG